MHCRFQLMMPGAHFSGLGSRTGFDPCAVRTILLPLHPHIHILDCLEVHVPKLGKGWHEFLLGDWMGIQGKVCSCQSHNNIWKKAHSRDICGAVVLVGDWRGPEGTDSLGCSYRGQLGLSWQSQQWQHKL